MYLNTANSSWFKQNKNIFNLKMSFFFSEYFQLKWERQNFLHPKLMILFSYSA